jgi:2,3-bisphosphoglycerate-independent phosphoglycerate mutase
MDHIELLSRIAQPEGGKVVLLVIDGVGDLRTTSQPETALEAAATPNMDALAARSALGRIVPVAPGVTPGSGPGHLALFGYDPTDDRTDIGRGALEALGVGVELSPGDVVARGNFATLDEQGRVTDRRAGRIPTEENRRLTEVLNGALADAGFGSDGGGPKVSIHSGEGHRFVILVEGKDLSPEIEDTDPQETGVPSLELTPRKPEAEDTIRRLRPALEAMLDALSGEARANGFLLRGFETLPKLPTMDALYHLRLGCFAGYPLYRGVAKLCGMEVVEAGKEVEELFAGVRDRWSDFDFLFIHVKEADKAGEDGDLWAKVRVLERVDAALPRLVDVLDPAADVLAITGDHSTPAPMKLHSWHPVPLLVHGPVCFVDDEEEFTEPATARGHLGTFPARELLGLLLGNAGRLRKFGA